MARQVEVGFHLEALKGEGARWSGDQARHVVSGLAGDRLPPGLFNKAEDRVTSMESSALVRWGGLDGGFRLIGLGEVGISEVMTATPTIVTALMEAYPGVVGLRRKGTDVSLRFSPQRRVYLASRMVMVEGISRLARYLLDLNDAQRREYARKRIVAGLLKQYDALQGLEGSAFGAELDEFDWEQFDLKIEAIGPFLPVKSRKGDKARYHNLNTIAFSANFELQGQWNVGGMHAHGFGNVWYARLPPMFASWQEYLDNGRGMIRDDERMLSIVREHRKRVGWEVRDAA